MSSESRRDLMHGWTSGYANGRAIKSAKTVKDLNSDLEAAVKKYQAAFHGDDLLGDKQFGLTGTLLDIREIFVWRNAKQICKVFSKWFTGQGLDVSTISIQGLKWRRWAAVPLGLTRI